jgi:perosamine synthetase
MISLHEPTFDQTDESYVLEALRSTWVSTGGPFVERFEREIAAYTGSRFAVSTVNGTSALHLMLETLKSIQGIDRFQKFDVLVPTLTFIATGNAVVHAGGNPVLLDSSLDLFNVRPSEVIDFLSKNYSYNVGSGRWISNDTKTPLLAFLPVHVMGWASFQSEIKQLATDLKICVLEDAAEALGTFSSDGTHAGRSGMASALSFNGNKILTTGGGGMILTDNEKFAKCAKHLSTTAKVDGLNYIHDEVGYNYRLVNLLAALGCSQLKKMDRSLLKKRNVFNAYRELLRSKSERVQVYEEKGCNSNNWLVNLVFESKQVRQRIIGKLLEERIGARPLWTPLHLQPAFAEVNKKAVDFRNAEAMWEKTVSVPSSPHLSLNEIEKICMVILKCLE